MLSLELVHSILHSAPDAMVIIDASGAILYTNRQVSTLFGYASGELEGVDIEMLLPERFRQRHIGHRRDYAENGRVRPMGTGLELFARRKEGTEFPVEISLSPISNGARPLVVAAIRDVTDRRTIQAQLNEAREAAERANQAKSRFLATASHDLRQPLQSLALINGAIRRIATDSELAEPLAHAHQAISAMSRLVNALLDIGKLESGVIKPEVTDFKVGEIFAQLRAEFAGLAAQKGLRLSVEPSAYCVHSDPSLVGQVLRNLVSNAIKYTRKGYVRLRCLHEHAFVRVEVLDTGIGIPPHALAHIYEEFYQVADSTGAPREGYGLGLSIVHRIVNLLGAQLQVQSEVGKGSTFALQLPASGELSEERGAGPSQGQISSGRHGRAPHVLLVEDDLGVRNATRMLLMAGGYRVTPASSSREALRQIAEHPDIDLIVSDYHLAEEQTGIDIIAAARQQLRSDLKAVLITGDTSSTVRDLPRDDALRIANKPINADELLSIVGELVRA